MTHKKIHRFQETGVIGDDSNIMRLRETYIKLLTDKMRDEGYVRLLDLDPAWSIEFNHETGKFGFLLTLHGIYLGKNEAKKTYGIANSRSIPLANPKADKVDTD